MGLVRAIFNDVSLGYVLMAFGATYLLCELQFRKRQRTIEEMKDFEGVETDE